MINPEVTETMTAIGSILTPISILGGVYVFLRGKVKDEIDTLKSDYKDLADNRQANIEAPKLLKAAAKSKGITRQQYIDAHIATTKINKAHILFLRKKTRIDFIQSKWKSDLLELQEVFQREHIQNHWEETLYKYEPAFQRFVKKYLISTKTK